MVILVNNKNISKKQINKQKNNKKNTKVQTNKKKVNQKNKKIKKKKFRIKFGVIICFLVLLCLIGLGIYYISNIKITNIYISGNHYLSDQEIIEIGQIENYPPTFKNSSSLLEQKLESNIYIKEAKVTKKLFTQVFITVEENRPLFYNNSINKTILLDRQNTNDKFNIPILINNIPESLYNEFVDKMGKLDSNILNKISELKYDPDEVDDERFLFSMTDSNYVYLTLNKLEDINNYNEIVKQFDNKKGILHLNSGGYFEIK